MSQKEWNFWIRIYSRMLIELGSVKNISELKDILKKKCSKTELVLRGAKKEWLE